MLPSPEWRRRTTLRDHRCLWRKGPPSGGWASPERCLGISFYLPAPRFPDVSRSAWGTPIQAHTRPFQVSRIPSLVEAFQGCAYRPRDDNQAVRRGSRRGEAQGKHSKDLANEGREGPTLSVVPAGPFRNGVLSDLPHL
jgi:hypothetical protein